MPTQPAKDVARDFFWIDGETAPRSGVRARSALLGASEPMNQLRQQIAAAACTDSVVHIVGDSGAGKELAAKALHAASARRGEPFVAINCSTLPSQLFESLAFGHERGSFTGAERAHRGYFEAVEHGTLFLDEVAELSLEHQTKLLRVVEERSFRPVGATEDRPFRGRIVSATHANLKERLDQGRFRQDLYYRLNVLRLRIPPLREHPADIPELVAAFARQLNRTFTFTAGALAVLRSHSWPGNGRELRNVVERLAATCPSGTVASDDVADVIDRGGEDVSELAQLAARLLDLRHVGGRPLDAFERSLIEVALMRSKGNNSAAAASLGIGRDALRRACERLGVSRAR